jgi:hypothetical protein
MTGFGATSKKQQLKLNRGDKIRIADVAAIKQSLSEGSLESAELRLQIALLTFPGDVELKALEVRLRNELRAKRIRDVPQTVVTPAIRGESRATEQQEQLYPTERSANETIDEDLRHSILNIGTRSTIPPSQNAAEIPLHGPANSRPRNIERQNRIRNLWNRRWTRFVAFSAALGLIGALATVVRHVWIQARPIETKLVVNSSPKNARFFLTGS